jgi:hypothetical protein
MKLIGPFLAICTVSLLCSCSREFYAKVTPPGTTNATVVESDAISAANDFMAYRGYTNTGIREYLTCYDYYRYRYTTNGVALPGAVFVDKKSGRVSLEW